MLTRLHHPHGHPPLLHQVPWPKFLHAVVTPRMVAIRLLVVLRDCLPWLHSPDRPWMNLGPIVLVQPAVPVVEVNPAVLVRPLTMSVWLRTRNLRTSVVGCMWKTMVFGTRWHFWIEVLSLILVVPVRLSGLLKNLPLRVKGRTTERMGTHYCSPTTSRLSSSFRSRYYQRAFFSHLYYYPL